MKTWKVTPSLSHVCLRSDNLQANSTDGQHKEAALLNKETASAHAIDAADFANNVLTNNGFGLMSSRSISDITFSYVSCVFCTPSFVHCRHGEPKWAQAWEAVLIRAVEGPNAQAWTSPGAS